MYLIEPFFKLSALENDIGQQSRLLNAVIDQWRYNGQIIGREIPLYLTEEDGEQGFAMRVICPEQDSLLPENNNQGFQIIADDLNADSTAECSQPAWQMLYTTHLQSCSPLHSGGDFSPIPLYKQLKNQPHLSQDLIKWQENWQACDQLQMNGSVLEKESLNEIAEVNSTLTKHGRYLAAEIEKESGIPTYYYLYRVGGHSLESEQQRCCPQCGGDWALNTPLFDVIYFKCDQCRLASNVSWNFL